jgi:hypothetical protein
MFEENEQKIGPAGVQALVRVRVRARVRVRVIVRRTSRRCGPPASRRVLACYALDGCACSLDYLRLQPRLPMVAASITYGCSLDYLRLQPRLSTVAASITYGCSLDYLRLQVLDLVEGGNAAKSGLIQKGDQLVGVTG